MTIIHFANHFLPDLGGVQLSVARTADAQMRCGHCVSIVTETPASGSDRQYPFDIRRFSVPVVRPFTRLLYWRWMWTQRRWLNSADVLHFHDYTTFVHWFLPLRMIIRHPRYAVTFHGFECFPVRRRHRFFRNLTARLVHARFAVGAYISRYYGHAVDASYVGAPVHTLPVLTRGEKQVFAYVGRLATDTGILDFALALRRSASANGTAVELRLAGDGPLSSDLQRLSDSSFDVRLLGVVDDLLPVYDGARYIIASGFLAIFDAFQTGLPVLIPAFNELKKHYTASITEIERMATVLENDAALAGVLGRLLSDEESEVLASRALAARKWIAGQSWDAVARLLDQFYSNESSGKHVLPSRQRRIGVCA